MLTAIHHRSAMLVATIILVAANDLLLAGTSPGWTMGVAILANLGLAWWRHPGLIRDHRSRILAGTIVICSGISVLNDARLVPVIAILALLSLVIMARGGLELDVPAWLRTVATAILAMPLNVLDDHRLVKAWRKRHGPSPVVRRLVGPWLLPLILGAVFAALFAVANPLIEDVLHRVGDCLLSLLTSLPELPAFTRILLWIATGLVAWAILRLRRHRQTAGTIWLDLTADAWYQHPELMVRCLLVVNGVFAVQMAMDAAYLTGGCGLPAGLTYAAYAHRGAYPLLVAALISAALVLTAFRPGGAAQDHPWARRLAAVWLGQNVLMTGAALWRLWLYVDAYSLTHWRLAAGLWMLLVATGLVLIAIRILTRHDNRWLIHGNALAILVVLLTWNGIDTDRLIAWHNVTHCAEVGAKAQGVDLAYIGGLGPSTAPALRWLAANSNHAQVAIHSGRLAELREQTLRRLLEDPRAWTWWRWTALPDAETTGIQQEYNHAR